MTSERRDPTSSRERRWARASDGLVASLMWRARTRAAKRADAAERAGSGSPKPKAVRREAPR